MVISAAASCTCSVQMCVSPAWEHILLPKTASLLYSNWFLVSNDGHHTDLNLTKKLHQCNATTERMMRHMIINFYWKREWKKTCIKSWHLVTSVLVGTRRNTSSISAVLRLRSMVSECWRMMLRPARSRTTLPSEKRQSQMRSTVYQHAHAYVYRVPKREDTKLMAVTQSNLNQVSLLDTKVNL